MKAVKKIASVALPVAAAFIPGVGPLMSAALVGGAGVLGSKLGGNSWGDALKAGALSGLTAGIAPIAGNAFASFAPETAGALGIGGGYNTIFGQGVGALSGMGGAAPSAASGALSQGTENFLSGLGADKISPALAAADPSLAANASGSGGGVLSKITNNPLGALGAAMTIGNAMQSGKVDGTQSQGQLLAQQQAKAAQDAAFSKQTIDMLNSAQSGRSPVVPNISDYYTYGTRPEATFFDKVNTPIQYGAS